LQPINEGDYDFNVERARLLGMILDSAIEVSAAVLVEDADGVNAALVVPMHEVAALLESGMHPDLLIRMIGAFVTALHGIALEGERAITAGDTVDRHELLIRAKVALLSESWMLRDRNEGETHG
jgi:hypothetical protein